jgi:hypothetical protein
MTIWLVVLLGASAAITLFAMAKLETQSVEEHSTDTATILAQAAESSLEVSMLNNAPEDVRQAINNMEEGETIDSVSVYRRNGTAWVSSTATPPAAYGQRRDALMSSMDLNRTVTSSGSGTISVFTPVPKQPECVVPPEEPTCSARVEVRMDEHPFRSRSPRTRGVADPRVDPLLFGIIVTIFAIRRTLSDRSRSSGSAASELGPGTCRSACPVPDVGARRGIHDVQRHGRAARDRGRRPAATTWTSCARISRGWRTSRRSSPRARGCARSRALGQEPRDARGGRVGIWRTGAEVPRRVGRRAPSAETVRQAEGDGAVTSGGTLDLLREDREIAWAVAPVRRQERTLGVVGIVWDPPRELDQERRDLLLSVCGLAGIAIENADLLESLARKEANLQGLLRKTLNVGGEAPPDRRTARPDKPGLSADDEHHLLEPDEAKQRRRGCQGTPRGGERLAEERRADGLCSPATFSTSWVDPTLGASPR